ncbi:hypothetical protein HpBGD54_15650 [Helicobacter pylori]
MPFIWFYPKNFNAPGFEITHDTKSYWESDWRIQTTFYAWFPLYSDYLSKDYYRACHLYKSQPAVDQLCVELGGRRRIKQQRKNTRQRPQNTHNHK